MALWSNGQGLGSMVYAANRSRAPGSRGSSGPGGDAGARVMGVETMPSLANESSVGDESMWLAIQGSVVAGSFLADCHVCAEKTRDQEYRGCQLALIIEPGHPFPMCRREFAQLSKSEAKRLLQQWGLESEYPRLFKEA